MGFVFILLGLSVAWLFMFKIEWLCKVGIVFWTLLLYCIMLFCFPYFMLNSAYDNLKMINALKMPLISLMVFKVMFYIFILKYKREPENTFGVFQNKAIQDVLFSILFWILGVGMPFFIV